MNNDKLFLFGLVGLIAYSILKKSPAGQVPLSQALTPAQQVHQFVDPATGMYYNPLADPCYQSGYFFDANACAAQGRQPYSS